MATFKAHRSSPEMVAPASPTPQESKTLSDVDSQFPLWYYATVVEFFRPRAASADGHETPPPVVVDAAKAIKEGLEKALVYYYPIAGRLTEVSKGKLAVDCTGEGVVFVEANADVRLDALGDPLVPPYPCIEELVCDIGDAKDVLGKPLVFMQVTRFKCGGFAMGVSICHNMADAFGANQFLKCVTDLARGDEHPAVLPVWERELLMARNPPDFTSLPFVSQQESATSPSLEDEKKVQQEPMPMDKMVGDYFLFGTREMAALRSQVTEPATNFEIITAAMWMCRTEAIADAGLGSQHPASSMLVAMNFRGKAPPLPRGFYGNAFVFVEAAAGELPDSLGGTVELVRKAKRGMTEEYVRSMVDLFSVGGAAPYAQGWTYVVSDITRIGEDGLDLGWAERVGGGVPIVGDDHATKLVSFQMRCKNADGEDCVVASLYLPEPAMDKFREKIVTLTNGSLAAPDKI